MPGKVPCRNDVPYASEASVHVHKLIPLWDERLSEESLRKRAALMGAREFERGYRQRAISEGELLWREKDVQFSLKKTHSVVRRVEKDDIWAKMAIYGGVDLAISKENAEAAFFSFMVIAVDGDGHRWVLNMHRERNIGFGTQVAIIKDFGDRYPFKMIKVESNGYQDAIIDHLGDSTLLPIQGLYTGAAQKKDIEIGLPSLAVEWEHKKWTIPWGDAEDQRLMEPFVEELATYPSAQYSDTIMSAFFARECTRAARGVMPTITILRF